MGNNKTVKPLPEGFMDGFSSALNSQLAVDQSIKKPEQAEGLVEEISTLQRKIAIAQGGGVGDVAKLSRQLGEAKNRLINEAKMKDAEVLAAAKKLAANGKDEKAKKFGQGLVDFYGKNNSFTPDQVAGLQNIMKNASFQLAKEETQLDEAKWSVKVGSKTYQVNAINSSQASEKAQRKAKEEGNRGVGGQIKRLSEAKKEAAHGDVVVINGMAYGFDAKQSSEPMLIPLKRTSWKDGLYRNGKLVEETQLDEAKWSVKVGSKTYQVNAINSSQASEKAQRKAKEEGNRGVGGQIKRLSEAKAPVTKKLDDGEGMDPVGKGDADIDNDGDTDSSDKYLHKRRKAIGKAMKRESVELDELSNKTLKSYMKKSANDDSFEKGNDARNSGDEKTAKKHFSKANKRLAGYKKARIKSAQKDMRGED